MCFQRGRSSSEIPFLLTVPAAHLNMVAIYSYRSDGVSFAWLSVSRTQSVPVDCDSGLAGYVKDKEKPCWTKVCASQTAKALTLATWGARVYMKLVLAVGEANHCVLVTHAFCTTAATTTTHLAVDS